MVVGLNLGDGGAHALLAATRQDARNEVGAQSAAVRVVADDDRDLSLPGIPRVLDDARDAYELGNLGATYPVGAGPATPSSSGGDTSATRATW